MSSILAQVKVDTAHVALLRVQALFESWKPQIESIPSACIASGITSSICNKAKVCTSHVVLRLCLHHSIQAGSVDVRFEIELALSVDLVVSQRTLDRCIDLVWYA